MSYTPSKAKTDNSSNEERTIKIFQKLFDMKSKRKGEENVQFGCTQ